MKIEMIDSNVVVESNGAPLRIPNSSWKSFSMETYLCSHEVFQASNTLYIRYLYVVALVWWRNHIDVKLIPSPKTPLAVMTSQNSGILKSDLQIQSQIHNHKMEDSTCKYSEEA